MGKLFKCRCSAMGKITTGISLEPIPLTEKQEIRLNELRQKESKSQERKALEKKLVEVPEAKLSTGAKTYIRDVWYGDKFDYQKTFSNKFTQKGNELEKRSIAYISKYLGVFGVKNEEHLSNEYTHGTPDVRLNNPRCTIDAKNVFYPNGLRFFEDEEQENDHIWQIHSYNFLDKKEVGYVVRILMNPPVHIIEKEAWGMWKSAGNHGQPDDEFINDVIDYFDFEKKRPLEDRINIFKVETNQSHIDIIKKADELANDYYAELNDQFEKRVKDILK